MNIPVVNIFDYEFIQDLRPILPDYIIGPEVISKNNFRSNKRRIFKYPGIKEDVYAPSFKPDPDILNDLGLNRENIVVTIRPPATEAHYHNSESEKLFIAVVDFLIKFKNVKIVILPRNEKKQTAWIKNLWGNFYKEGKILIPDHVINGLDMIWFSDFVVSGGGTMNREAAALNVPVYSIFRGKIGAVDQHLADSGRLTLIESVEEIKRKVRVIKREKSGYVNIDNSNALNIITDTIVRITERM